MGVKKDWCVSIYMPAQKAGREKRQNPILFKNLAKKAERQLSQAGIPDKEKQEILQRAQDLLKNRSFWQYQSQGLASFLSIGLFQTLRLPERFEKLAVVAKRFHLKPLLPLLTSGGNFFVLSLSQNEVRLLRGTRYGLSVVQLDEVPGSLIEALKYDEPDTQLQFHTGTRHGKGKRAAVFHGHGAGVDDKKEDLLHYFQRVDKGLQDILREEDAPMVLASVDYYWPIYKEANSYSHLADEGIKGNPEEIGEDELHQRAWRIVQPIFAKKQAESLEEFREYQAGSRTSSDLKVVVPAAHQGRIALLFVALGVQRWGVYNPRKNEVLVHEKARAANQDLLDLAAIQTFLNGGAAYALAPENMPDRVPIAAVFRY